MNLKNLREQIDQIDAELVRLFEQRMNVSTQIAACKQADGLPIYDRTREVAKMQEISGKVSAELTPHIQTLYDTLFELSKIHQRAATRQVSPMREQIKAAMRDSFPKSATVACPGVEGSFSQMACEQLFVHPNIIHVSSQSFDKVFTAVESGLCDYGVLPLENSTTGLVGKIYDLMQSNHSNFKIVKSIRIAVSHNLLAPPNVKLEDIREVFSHEQALRQCGKYLDTHLDGVVKTACENTALAAEIVAKSGRKDVAAICSSRCAYLYGLNIINRDIQDETGNCTRFICISKGLEIYPNANRTSIIMVLPNQQGSLVKALARFSAHDINLTKLESRPLFDTSSPGKVMFYLDFDASPQTQTFARLMDEMKVFCDEFQYLGSYTEVI